MHYNTTRKQRNSKKMTPEQYRSHLLFIKLSVNMGSVHVILVTFLLIISASHTTISAGVSTLMIFLIRLFQDWELSLQFQSIHDRKNYITILEHGSVIIVPNIALCPHGAAIKNFLKNPYYLLNIVFSHHGRTQNPRDPACNNYGRFSHIPEAATPENWEHVISWENSVMGWE